MGVAVGYLEDHLLQLVLNTIPGGSIWYAVNVDCLLIVIHEKASYLGLYLLFGKLSPQ